MVNLSIRKIYVFLNKYKISYKQSLLGAYERQHFVYYFISFFYVYAISIPKAESMIEISYSWIWIKLCLSGNRNKN